MRYVNFDLNNSFNLSFSNAQAKNLGEIVLSNVLGFGPVIIISLNHESAFFISLFSEKIKK